MTKRIDYEGAPLEFNGKYVRLIIIDGKSSGMCRDSLEGRHDRIR